MTTEATEQHPFLVLRQAIRTATRQFRHNNDTSSSLFHPDHGFIYAYDLTEVEDALTAYEETLPTAFVEDADAMSREDELIQMGSRLVASSNDVGVREVAQETVAYLIGQQLEDRGQILDFIQRDAERPVCLAELDPSVSESS